MSTTRMTAAVLAMAGAAAISSAQIELTTNGGFEAGDTSGWDSFPTLGSSFNVTSDANSGDFAGELFNDVEASGALIKQANIGVGVVNPGDEITISFAAKGSTANGGVVFAEFFSEIDGGGVSMSEILSGGPLPLTDTYQMFSFTTNAASDVSGGVTLQFGAITGAVQDSVAVLFIDDVSVTVIPAPGAVALLGVGGVVATRRRR